VVALGGGYFLLRRASRPDGADEADGPPREGN